MAHLLHFFSNLRHISDIHSFWPLCLIVPFFQSAHRVFGWTTIKWMFSRLHDWHRLSAVPRGVPLTESLVLLGFLIEILLPFFWDCFVGSREYDASIWDASPRCLIVTSMASCCHNMSKHCLTVTFLPFAISFRLHSGFMQPWIRISLSTTRNSMTRL